MQLRWAVIRNNPLGFWLAATTENQTQSQDASGPIGHPASHSAVTLRGRDRLAPLSDVDSIQTEICRTSENDFECLARTGVNTPTTIFPKLSDGCQTRPVRRPTASADPSRLLLNKTPLCPHYWLLLGTIWNPSLAACFRKRTSAYRKAGLFLLGEGSFVIWLPRTQQMIDDTSELICGRCHCLECAELPLHPTVKLSKACCSHSQGDRDPILQFAGAEYTGPSPR